MALWEWVPALLAFLLAVVAVGYAIERRRIRRRGRIIVRHDEGAPKGKIKISGKRFFPGKTIILRVEPWGEPDHNITLGRVLADKGGAFSEYELDILLTISYEHLWRVVAYGAVLDRSSCAYYQF